MSFTKKTSYLQALYWLFLSAFLLLQPPLNALNVNQFTWSDREPQNSCTFFNRLLLIFSRNPPPELERIYGIRIHFSMGRGRMGRVWRGSGVTPGRPTPLVVKEAILGQERFLDREFTVLSRLYPGRVRRLSVWDRENQETRQFIVMELTPADPLHPFEAAPTLADLLQGDTSPALRQTGPRSPFVQQVQATLLNELQRLHGMDIFHGDIKPENILVSRDAGGTANANFIDFGLADAPGLEPVGHYTYGSPGYMSPEVLTRDTTPHGERTSRESLMASDVWAIQRALFELHLGYQLSRSNANVVHRTARSLDNAPWNDPLAVYDSNPELIAPEVAMVLQSHVARDVSTLRHMLDETRAPSQFVGEFARRWQTAFRARTDPRSREDLVLDLLLARTLGPRVLAELSPEVRNEVLAAGRALISGENNQPRDERFGYTSAMAPVIREFLQAALPHP